MNRYIPIIGLEIHVELKTNSKMFCGCKNDPFHASKPNIYTCPTCLGLPGALPVPNKKAVEWTVMLGQALNCTIPLESKFDRKNYFYPDLPKGYQISQYDMPLALNGKLKISRDPSTASNITSSKRAQDDKPDLNSLSDLSNKVVRINRVHLEEDTGKLLHKTIQGKKVTLIDFNRSGVPLVEIVTEPDIRSANQAVEFLKKLRQIIRYLGISDADMEKGSMRLEPNISVLKVQSSKFKVQSEKEKILPKKLPDYKVEVKNINSFKFVKRAIEYEVQRQIKALDKGEKLHQETRGWDEKRSVTIPQRRKEEAHDYRYFPEPDIPPIRWTKKQILDINKQIFELPDEKLHRFQKEYGLSDHYALLATKTREIADYLEDCIKYSMRQAQDRQVSSIKFKDITPTDIANWLFNKKINISKVTPLELIQQIVKSKTIIQIDQSHLDKVIRQVIKKHTRAVTDYKSGKDQAIMFLVGQVMKEIKVKIDVILVKKKLESLLKP